MPSRRRLALALLSLLLLASGPPPTPDIQAITARAVVRACMRYLTPLRVVLEEFTEFDPALIVAIMAQESGCQLDADDPFSDSTGLMQVNPPTGRNVCFMTAEALRVPRLNIWCGVRVLQFTLNSEEHNPEHDLRRALAGYNCSWKRLDEGGCGPGGYNYADRILEWWLPFAREALHEFAAKTYETLWYQENDRWLESLGYGGEPEPIAPRPTECYTEPERRRSCAKPYCSSPSSRCCLWWRLHR